MESVKFKAALTRSLKFSRSSSNPRWTKPGTSRVSPGPSSRSSSSTTVRPRRPPTRPRTSTWATSAWFRAAPFYGLFLASNVLLAGVPSLAQNIFNTCCKIQNPCKVPARYKAPSHWKPPVTSKPGLTTHGLGCKDPGIPMTPWPGGKGTHSKHSHWPSWVGSHLPDKCQPKRPRTWATM